MNIKLYTPKFLKSGSGMASMKQLFLSLIATTISIILTFGTAALIDYNKKKSEKREMVMMILNDFNNNIEKMQEIDSTAIQAFETQLSILENPQTFNRRVEELLFLEVALRFQPSKTVEAIISSNIETINTIGNISFAEKVSEFYQNRQQYFDDMRDMVQETFHSENGISTSYENMAKNSLVPFMTIGEGYIKKQQAITEQCKKMMDVSDEDIAVYTRERQKLNTLFDETDINQNINTMKERNQRFEQAKEKGRNQ
jgi:hypothetical protein